MFLLLIAFGIWRDTESRGSDVVFSHNWAAVAGCGLCLVLLGLWVQERRRQNLRKKAEAVFFDDE